jgi:hypothetical protein
VGKRTQQSLPIGSEVGRRIIRSVLGSIRGGGRR